MKYNRSLALTYDTEQLVAETRLLVRTAAEQVERLRLNLLEFRIQEMRRQLALGMLRRQLEQLEPLRLVGSADPLEITVEAVNRDEDEVVPAQATLH